MMREGMPVAAYMGALVALALSAAFVATLAIVVFLPPRPPDVMPADAVAELFADGYEYMRDEGRTLPGSGMVWRVSANEPAQRDGEPIDFAQIKVADELDISPDQVRVAAQHVRRSDVFVFQVRDIHEMQRDAIEAASEAMMEAEHEMTMAQAEVESAEAHMRSFEGVLSTFDQLSEEDRAEIRAGVAEARAELAQAIAQQQAAEAIKRQARAALRAVRREVVHAETPVEPLARGQAPAPPQPPAPPEMPLFAPAPQGVPLISGFLVSAQLPDGRWLTMRQGRNWDELGWIARAALVIGGALTVLTLLAMLFASRLTRPIRNFSSAVQAVGVDPQSAPVREEGPRELRGAARAVNTMQARLRALIADRTKTLAAVAHDMRTPLMRLRLAAEHAPEEQRERMAKEIAEVEALVASFIAFARDDPAEEARVRVDLAALLQSIADDHVEAGRDVSFAGDERLIVTGQSLGLKRLFSNLIENALKYGKIARITLRREGEGQIIVDIDDDGPGVPVEQRESVFEPFVRLGEGGGGAGLGLPAARSIARAHGGDIVILDGETAGARFRVTLPA